MTNGSALTGQWAEGAWDIHVHASPSLYPRWGDAFELVQKCTEAQMRGVVLKSHHGSSVEVAALLSKRSLSLKVFGGVVLNEFVGGLNPLAVETAIQMGAKIVWLPTVHAKFHGEKFNNLGGFHFQDKKLVHTPSQGLSVIDDKGELLTELKEILELHHQTAVVLGTGHISPTEIMALKKYIQREKRQIRLLVNHTFFTTPELTISEVSELADSFIWFEVCFFTQTKMANARGAKWIAQGLSQAPHLNWILASDSGQKENPPSPEALNLFADGLSKQGVSKEVLRKALTTTPEELLT